MFQNRQPPKSPDDTIASRLPNKAVFMNRFCFVLILPEKPETLFRRPSHTESA
ncbi:hypothetical protein NEISICOT_01151 [Neisseria sicca ATCC 29256]|uniref:Uncharacterized protein n=1 Tax=Neisseria sicca ATCC 29256 TaxID=547045 RepID=C6M3K3_NEISI|nr:hypothetical protein NEISICOT_01151 [Neisseria sicca ATCC 29256]